MCLALNWLFDYFLPRSIVQIANNPATATTYRHYARGDVICRPGQTIAGFYTVIRGAMESRIPNREGQDDFVRVFGPGDHWGERSLAKGTLTAIEETQLLVLQRSDFLSLSAAFPALNRYFENISDKTYAPGAAWCCEEIHRQDLTAASDLFTFDRIRLDACSCKSSESNLLQQCVVGWQFMRNPFCQPMFHFG